MTRSFGVVSLVVSLALAGWIVSLQLKHTGPSASTASTAIEQANAVASAVTFRQAEAALEQSRSLNGTYANADLSGFGVSLVRADTSSYCIQAGQTGAVTHDNGPGGAPAAGPC